MKQKPRRGMTLAEIMIAITIFGVVFGGAITFLVAQSKGLRVLATQSNAVQNGRFGRDLLRTELRTAGTGVTEEQPIIVLANDSAFAFNADLTTASKDSASLTGAVYVDIYAEPGMVTALRQGSAISVPGSNPSVAYPLQDYSQTPLVFINSEAELLSFWFTPDTAGIEGTYALMRQVNDGAAEVVATGIRKSTDQPFFRYYYDPAKFGAVNPSLDTVPAAWLPLAKTVAQRGLGADTGTAVTTRIDALRAVEVNYEVLPKRGSVNEIVRYLIPLPNVAHARQSRACGRPPITPVAPSVMWRSDSSFVQVTIPRAVDDGAGEGDAVRYVVWRKLSGSPTWGDPISTIAANQAASYQIRDMGMPVRPGIYQYAVAVQDCTPNLSGIAASATVSVP